MAQKKFQLFETGELKHLSNRLEKIKRDSESSGERNWIMIKKSIETQEVWLESIINCKRVGRLKKGWLKVGEPSSRTVTSRLFNSVKVLRKKA